MNYQTELDINKCQNDHEFEVMCGSKNLINNYINKEIFPNYSYDVELKSYKINQVIKKLFDGSGEIDSKLSEEFLKLMNEESTHKAAFVILSQLRTNSRFLRNKSLIELLAKGFNISLSLSEKNKNYDNVKSCIILSQTYFYNDENNKKVYIFDYIKNNPWLKSSSFWRSFIDDMIKK